jgi:NAD(P)H-hydrate repair Nnr-like enzyme with NAD(P)H-hydrate epimerase domain
MNDREILQAKWESGYCPLINGVTFEDGIIERLEIDRVPRGEIVVERAGATTLAEFLSENANAFSALTEYCVLELPDRRLRLTSGGGSGGGDGYIAASDLATNYLRWILFFDDANEFEKLGLHNEAIIAETNLRETWEISLANPGDIVVHAKNEWD